MKSATAFTYELDDVERAVSELTAQIREKLVFEKNTVAVLHAQPAIDLSGLAAALSRELGCDVVGGTIAGSAVFTNEGFHELGLALHVITGGDVFFASAISGSMEADPEKEIADTYHRARSLLREQDASAEPKLAFLITPPLGSCSPDSAVQILTEICVTVPIFGYAAADDFEFIDWRVFRNEVCDRDRMLVLLFAGNIRPLFQVENLSTRKALKKNLITKTHGNVISEIDGKPAFEYIKNLPDFSSEASLLWHYHFFVDIQNNSKTETVSVCRSLNSHDEEKGEFSCFGDVPEDTTFGVLACDDKDVKKSCELAMKEFADKLAADESGYEYSTVLIVSCGMRNMYLVGAKELEANLVRDMLPDGLVASGLYGFGEIAPVSTASGEEVNAFHNATFTMCAF